MEARRGEEGGMEEGEQRMEQDEREMRTKNDRVS